MDKELKKALNKADLKMWGQACLFGVILGGTIYCICKLAVRMGNVETAAAYQAANAEHKGAE